MKQTTLKKIFWIKSYSQNNEQMSFFSIDFIAIWTLLSCDYFQTIVNSSITLGWHMSSSSLGLGTKIYYRGFLAHTTPVYFFIFISYCKFIFGWIQCHRPSMKTRTQLMIFGFFIIHIRILITYKLNIAI